MLPGISNILTQGGSRDSAVSIGTGYWLDVRSRDSAVGIATGYGLDYLGVGVRTPVRSRIFSSPRHPDQLWCPPNFPSNWYRSSFPGGVRRLGRELSNSPPASAEVKKMWIYRYIHSPIRLHGVVFN
jgi:hypothetical protein